MLVDSLGDVPLPPSMGGRFDHEFSKPSGSCTWRRLGSATPQLCYHIAMDSDLHTQIAIFLDPADQFRELLTYLADGYLH